MLARIQTFPTFFTSETFRMPVITQRLLPFRCTVKEMGFMKYLIKINALSKSFQYITYICNVTVMELNYNTVSE